MSSGLLILFFYLVNEVLSDAMTYTRETHCLLLVFGNAQTFPVEKNKADKSLKIKQAWWLKETVLCSQ